MANGDPTPGTVTGLYREDEVANSAQPVFAHTSDVFREVQPALTDSNDTDDSYAARIDESKKGLT